MWTLLQRAASGKGNVWRRIKIDSSGAIKEERLRLAEDRPAVHAHLERRTVLDYTVQRIRLALKAALLPVGYPLTVHPHFLPFTSWNVLQGIVGGAAGVLATQCLLVGLGQGSPSTAALGGGSIALAATLNWILKDGLGNAGAILFVSQLGDRFDKDAKRYRFFAAAALNFAMLMECMVPLFPAAFLPLAAVANTCKSISWMANSATRAHMQMHFAKGDNLGDITGKSAAASTAASVIGTGLGVALSKVFLDESLGTLSPQSLVFRCLLVSLPLVAVYMWASYRSCKLGVSPRLSLQRLDLVLRPLAASLVDVKGGLSIKNSQELHRYILDPTVAGLKERFLTLKPKKLLSIEFEPDVSTLLPVLRIGDKMKNYGEFFVQHSYVATLRPNDARLPVWFSDQMKTSEMITGLLSLYVARVLYEREKGALDWIMAMSKGADIVADLGSERLIDTFRQRGWDLEDIDLDRNPLLIANKTD